MNVITVTPDDGGIMPKRFFIDVESTEFGFEGQRKRIEIPLDLARYITALQQADRRKKKALDAIYNHNEAARAAVIQHYGTLHSPVPTGDAER